MIKGCQIILFVNSEPYKVNGFETSLQPFEVSSFTLCLISLPINAKFHSFELFAKHSKEWPPFSARHVILKKGYNVLTSCLLKKFTPVAILC